LTIINNAKFALIAHPPDMNLYRAYIKYLKPGKNFRDALLLKLFEWAPSYKVKEFHRITFDKKKFAEGMMIMVPFLPEMKDIRFGEVLKKVEDAIAMAADAGCSVAALGAFTSIVIQGREDDFERKYTIKLTSGNTLTAALIIQSIEDITEKFNMDLKEQALAIIGASGDIGSGCMSWFGDKVKKMYLTARGVSSLQTIVDKYSDTIKCEYEISNDNETAVKNATIVLFTTSAYTTLFSIDDFNPGTVVCDASAPLNVTAPKTLRPDVFLYHGGIAALPFTIDPGFDIGLASTSNLYGCMTEGICMSLDHSLPSSKGRGNITRDKITVYKTVLENTPGLDAALTVGNKTYSRNELENYSKEWQHAQCASRN